MASSAVLIVQEEQFEDEDFALSEESQEFLEKGYEKLPQCKNRRNYACPECDYFTQNPRSYLHHLKDVHKHKIRIYECPNCLYASKHSQKLQRHVQMVHGMGKNKKWKPQQKFDEVENSKFEEIHDELTEDKMFKCPMCPFTSRSQTLVVRHEKVVHLKKKFFRCSKCNYVTHMKARFTKHVKYHSMPMIKCEQCDFKSPYKWNLDRHMKNHAGGGAFKCSLCNFTADIKQSLTVHEMNHHVPPVGHTAPSKRKNRVGASDSNPTEPSPVHDDELLQLERDADMHQSQMHAFNELSMLNEIEITKKPENPSSLRKPVMKKPKPMAQFSAKELTVKIGEKVVNPGDVIQHKNGTVYIKKLKCRVCNYRAAWESEMSRHEQRVHGLEEKKPIQKSPRPIPDLKPIPNLIPIQNKQPPQQTRPTPPPPPALPLPPPPALPLMHQSRPMMQKHMMPHLPFQQGMNRHPFLHHHLQPHHPPPPYPQSHNLPPQYPHHLPSRFAQPKNIMPKMKGFPVNQLPKQKPPRPSPPPPPILKIPTPTKLRNSATSTPPPSNSSNSTPASTPDKTMTDKDLNDICAKSCPTSSLKDFASLMGGDEAFRPGSGNNALTKGACDVNRSDKIQDSIDNHNDDGPKSPEAKKKNSFFDELKEKFGAGESCNLICNLCGHESKCLSESLRHQKIHSFAGNNSGGGTVFSNADLSSTRCQYCRQRCKTSADLLTHLKSCAEANKGSTEPINIEDEDEEEEEKGDVDETEGERMEFKDGETDEDYKSEEGLDDSEGQNPHPMENKVFVWTNMANGEEDGLDDEYECGSQSPSSDCVFGVETAPGIGAVTSTNKAASHGNQTGQMVQNKEVKPKPDNSVKKVYKCPHCSFWASTASRFHVHIVGHLNKKPFECSLCCYRSNWRWDITKHIRLKTMRDSTHQRAKVLMTDETGRRNYSKYNKYLTLMRVHEPAGESSGTGLRGKKVTQSFEPIETLPAPPKLTPAPQSSLQGENNGPASNGSSPTYRPAYSKPPPLQPSYDMKRKNAEDSEDEPPKKKGPLENKKTMWKCKKCLFRDSDRAVVLAHVKEHYRTQSLQAGNDSSDERHCRLKHNGDVKVILAPRHNSDEQEKTEDENEAESFLCETCPFVGTSQQSLDEHMEKHFERPDAPFKCYFCPFYVSDNNELMEHMSLHGEPESDDSSTTFREEDSSSVVYSPSKDNTDLFMNKRYRCSSCPYVTNSKTQFLYHKQFHRPRGAPFQCHLCSYNVPRRHFLQQHLRLHGINTPLPKIKNSGTFDPETPLNIKEIDTSNMPEIPLVWVSKLGSLTKMFKCRYCPHVNIRKSNIQEHEKMHGIRVKPNSEGSSPIPQQQHHCPECNYICNNAGVLSSHVKVHQGLFGQVCGLVDLSRSDEEQIRDLNTLLGREEEGPPEISPDEINKDFKENSSTVQSTPEKDSDSNVDNRVLHFCSICPARFLYTKELEIHMRFHSLQLQFQCDSCSYTARQQPHLLAHYKVHTDEYQDRTTALCEVYQISEENPKPKIAVIVDGSEEVGPAWVVVERQKLPAKDPQNEYDLDEAPSEVSQHGNRIVIKQFACDKCPATFFKAVALQYHSALHGGPGPHKCRVCDYAVKTYGNLIKHESVHEDLQPRAKLKNKSKKAQENIPTSGTELFKQKTEANQKVAAAPPPPPAPLHIDPEFGILMHGSPEFIYPTYLKNGRLKEKRYKCHKCPSAFEKREQYKVHLSLHGSKQRYSCERCDYSVKYYANYIQHLRKHQSNDVCKAERKTSGDRSTEESVNEDGSESTTETPIPDEILPQPPMSSRSGKKMQLSMADQQATMLMQQRVISNSMSAPEIINRCPQCPYSNQRKDGVGSHVKCHSNVKGGAFACKYCDYTVPQQHFLREHNKLHFSPLKSHRPEAYMKLDRLELWSEPVVNNDEDKTSEDKPKKVLIFKDRGVNFKEDRFLPVYSEENSEQPEDEKERIYINMKTGEVDNSNSENSDSSEKEDVREGVELNTADENNLTVNSVIPAECGDIPTNRESNIINSEKPDIDCQMPSEETKLLDKDKDDEVLESPIPMEVDEEKCHDIPNSPVSSGNVVQEQTADSRSSNIADNFVNSETDACILAEVKTIEQGNDLSNETKNVTESALELENFEAADHESRGSKVDEKSKEVQTANQPSEGESGDKTEVKASTEGTSDSDSEDSSSDSSSSDDSQDSSSSSVTSSQPQQ